MNSETLINSIAPFIGQKVDNRKEVIDNISLLIKNNIEEREKLAVILFDFINGEFVRIDGCSYKKGVNDYLFIEKINSKYEIKARKEGAR